MQYANEEAIKLSKETVNFSFGQNWQKYISILDRTRIESARRSIQEFTGLQNLRGYRFLDAGCGSGLFSLAAWLLDASLVVSMDIDPYSVQCTRKLWEKHGSPSNWFVVQGSVLAPPFSRSSLRANFVYSWGVLHHTGAMYKAIGEVADLVDGTGLFYLAIYNACRFSRQWLALKRFYNRSPWIVRRLMYIGFVVFAVLMLIRERRNPITAIRHYGKTRRGMSWFRDIEDWLGGLPYEVARSDEIIDFLGRRDFSLRRIRVTTGSGNNEFLFTRMIPEKSATLEKRP